MVKIRADDSSACTPIQVNLWISTQTINKIVYFPGSSVAANSLSCPNISPKTYVTRLKPYLKNSISEGEEGNFPLPSTRTDIVPNFWVEDPSSHILITDDEDDAFTFQHIDNVLRFAQEDLYCPYVSSPHPSLHLNFLTSIANITCQILWQSVTSVASPCRKVATSKTIQVECGYTYQWRRRVWTWPASMGCFAIEQETGPLCANMSSFQGHVTNKTPKQTNLLILA